MNDAQITIKVIGSWKYTGRNVLKFYLGNPNDPYMVCISHTVFEMMNLYWAFIGCPVDQRFRFSWDAEIALLDGAESFNPEDLVETMQEVFKLDIVVKEEPHDT